MIDAKAATIIFLKADVPLSVLTNDRVYYDGLTFQEDDQSMPHKGISISRSGGPEDSDYSANHYERFDIKCWGETEREAWRVHARLHHLLKNFVPQNIVTPDGAMRLFNFVRSGGPNELRDPDFIDWPFVWSSWLVKSSTVEILDGGMFSPMFARMFA